MEQVIRFCTADDGVSLAWSSLGHGPPLVKAANWLTHLEHDLRSPVWEPWLRTLSRSHRLVRYDQRGCGLSDHDTTRFDLDALVGDLEAVVDAAGLDRFALLGLSQGASISIRYAARHPERVSALVLCGGYARGRYNRDLTPAQRDQDALLQQAIEVGWGRDDPAFRRVFTDLFVPGGTDEQRRWFDELCRVSTSPETAARLREAWGWIDVTAELAAVRAPTLVAHGRGDVMCPYPEGLLMAAGIPGARFLPLDTADHVLLEGEPAFDLFFDAVAGLLGDTAPSVAVTGDVLSEREREVLRLVARGLANDQIGQALHLSPRTVERHLANAYAKLGLSGRSARAAAAALVGQGEQ